MGLSQDVMESKDGLKLASLLVMNLTKPAGNTNPQVIYATYLGITSKPHPELIHLYLNDH